MIICKKGNKKKSLSYLQLVNGAGNSILVNSNSKNSRFLLALPPYTGQGNVWCCHSVTLGITRNWKPKTGLQNVAQFLHFIDEKTNFKGALRNRAESNWKASLFSTEIRISLMYLVPPDKRGYTICQNILEIPVRKINQFRIVIFILSTPWVKKKSAKFCHNST